MDTRLSGQVNFSISVFLLAGAAGYIDHPHARTRRSTLRILRAYPKVLAFSHTRIAHFMVNVFD